MNSPVSTTDYQQASRTLWQQLNPHLSYLSQKDKDMVELAFDQMCIAHEGDRRKSGEFYIIHPVEACINLTELKMDAVTLAATLMHDVPEDTSTSLSDLAKEFPPEVVFLVEGVTKLSKVKYQGEDRYAENLRKMFVAMSQDLRVVFIKLADRLHNLQTLDHVKPEKQHRIALESLEIYAPIAERLGISKLQNAIEDASFPYVYPDVYKQFIQQSDVEIKRREKNVNKILKKIKKLLEENNIKAEKVVGRAKKYYSLYKKLKNKQKTLKDIHDLIAVRVITDNVADCYFVLSLLQEHFTILPERTKDYIANPKPNGYQSLHLVAIEDGVGTPFEFQIRTKEMHEFAEYGVAAHFAYKAKQGSTKDVSQFLSGENLKWMKELISLGKEKLSSEEYLQKLKLDIFQDRIFVLTPKNDAIDLPKGSTPLDFAYRIHEEVGNHATMAKINGQIAKLSTELSNGDILEIITDKRQSPSPRWLEWVKTRSARHHIKSTLKKKGVVS